MHVARLALTDFRSYADALVAHGLEPEDLRADRGSLEDAYLALCHTEDDAGSGR